MPKVTRHKTTAATTTTPAAPYTFIRSETELFSEPAYDISLSSSSAAEYHPITSLSDSTAPLEFFIQGNETQYIDLSETKLYIRVSILAGDGKALPDTVIVAPVNNFLHSLFQQCTVYLNEVMITPSSNQYAYRSYIETLLAYGKEYKKSQAQCALYYKDKDPTNKNPEVADGFKSRFDISKASGAFELVGRPFSDLFAQNKFLIPSIDLRVQFLRSTPEFCLISANDAKFQINITEARLIVQKHNLLPSLTTTHLKSLEDGNLVTYPLRRVEVKTYTLAPGSVQNINENLLTGLLPDRIIIGLVESSKYIGTIVSNPFEFKDFQLSYIDVSVNGENSSNLATHVNFAQNQYIQLYYNLFDGLGVTNDDTGIELTRTEFKTCPLMAYNLRHVKDGFTTPKHGNVKIELKFRRGLEHAVTVVVYAEYQSILYIDKNKNIFYKDYNIHTSG